MVTEDDRFILRGPKPVDPISEDSLGKIIYDSLCEDFDRQQPVMTDAASDESISYQTLLEKSCTLAEALRRFGCDSDTVVTISSENNLEFFVPTVATLFVGSILASVNIFYGPEELRHALCLTETRLVFVSAGVAAKFVEARKRTGFVEKLILFDSEVAIEGVQTVKEFVAEQLGTSRVSPMDFRPWNGDNSKPAFVLYSSGTTGLPKGVMLTHKNYATRIAQTRHPRQRLVPNGTISGILPFFHGFGMTMGITSIVNKNRTVLLRRFDEDLFLKAIEKYKIEIVIVAPPVAVFLAKTSKVKNYDLSSLKDFVCGAAPLSKHIVASLKERLNLKTLRQGYGLTEATLAITTMEIGTERIGSSGQIHPYLLVKVRDPETGRSLGPHQVGEICVKGPTVMKGYYRNEQATKESFTSEGWLKTGDLGYYDDDQYFFIVDRLKELIKYKGYQVAPAELEAMLINHPKVLDVGVVGLPDELAGELPTAFIVKKVPDVTEAELQEFVARKVSPQKRLRGGVIFVPSIPKNASGKILRRELKQLLKNYKAPQESKL